MKDLNNCLYCDSADILVGQQENNMPTRSPAHYIGYSAICQSCGARGPIAKVSKTHDALERHNAVEEAAALWNRKLLVVHA